MSGNLHSACTSVNDKARHSFALSPLTQVNDYDKITELSTATAVLLVKTRRCLPTRKRRLIETQLFHSWLQKEVSIVAFAFEYKQTQRQCCVQQTGIILVILAPSFIMVKELIVLRLSTTRMTSVLSRRMQQQQQRCGHVAHLERLLYVLRDTSRHGPHWQLPLSTTTRKLWLWEGPILDCIP